MTEEKRFVEDHSYLVSYDKYCILDKAQHKHLYLDEVVDLLNEQQDTIIEQKEKVARVLNEYSRQFRRYTKEFSFMFDLAEDLGVENLEAGDD